MRLRQIPPTAKTSNPKQSRSEGVASTSSPAYQACPKLLEGEPAQSHDLPMWIARSTMSQKIFGWRLDTVPLSPHR